MQKLDASLRRSIKVVLFACGVTSLAACSAQTATVPADWKRECVGRMELSLPGEVDVAANSFKMLMSEYKVGTQQPRFEFEDGQQAGYSSQHFRGSVFVSHSLSASQRGELLAAASDAEQLAKAYAKRTKRDNNGNLLVFESLDVAPLRGYASRVNADVDMTVELGDHVMVSSSSGRTSDVSSARKSFEMKVRGAAARPGGSLPREQGVCLPYAFIRDDGLQSRSIGVTYRIKDQPDVTIWLEDSSAHAVAHDQNPAKFTPEYKTEFFWKQEYQDPKSYRWLWPRLHDVMLDNRKGVASFVELKRLDDTTDYGYLAVVRGDPDAKEDTPDLMLYVIRDAKNAIAKGKQPIDKDEFLKMAQTIAGSVKRRSVQ